MRSRLSLESLEGRLVPALIGPELLNPYDVPTSPSVVAPVETLPGYTPMASGPVVTSPSIIVYSPQPLPPPTGLTPFEPYRPVGPAGSP